MTNNAQAEMVGRLRAYPNCFVRMGDVGFAGLSDDIVAAAAEIERMAGEIAALREALSKIERWFGEFPDTGKTWNDGKPMSYGACYGSNGERDFMRAIARQALGESQ